MAWSQCMTTIPRGLLNVKLIEPPCTERYARWCERSANQLMISLLLDWKNIVNILSDSLLENYEVATAINEV